MGLIEDIYQLQREGLSSGEISARVDISKDIIDAYLKGVKKEEELAARMIEENNLAKERYRMLVSKREIL